MLAQHHTNMAKALEHRVHHERTRNHAKLAAKTVEVEQARHKLAEERSRVVSLFQETDELRLSDSVEQNRRFQVDDRARRVNDVRKLMEDQLAKALEDQATTEKEM